MGKYPILKEFFPFSHFTPPISEKFLKMAVPHMKTPKFIFKDRALDVIRYEIAVGGGSKVEAFLMAQKNIVQHAPTTQAALEARIRFMKEQYKQEKK